MNIKISDMIKYRSIWMAFAIIWIVLYHSSITFSLHFFDNIKMIGYGGTDIFLFSSGLGCYYSLHKSNNDYFKFFCRRLKKIVPIYECFIVIWCFAKVIFDNICLRDIVGNIFFIQYLTGNGNYFNWYVSAMWIFYFMSCFFVIVIDKIKTFKKFTILILIVLLFTLSFWNSMDLIIIITRLPIFLSGMYISKLSVNSKTLKKKQMVISYFLMLIGFVFLYYSINKLPDFLWSYGLYWYPFLLITHGLCVLITLFSMKIERYKLGKSFLKSLFFIGNHTFEIYLTHILIFSFYSKLIEKNVLADLNIYWILAIILIIPSCFLLNLYCKLVSFLVMLVYRKIKLKSYI